MFVFAGAADSACAREAGSPDPFSAALSRPPPRFASPAALPRHRDARPRGHVWPVGVLCLVVPLHAGLVVVRVSFAVVVPPRAEWTIFYLRIFPPPAALHCHGTATRQLGTRIALAKVHTTCNRAPLVAHAQLPCSVSAASPHTVCTGTPLWAGLTTHAPAAPPPRHCNPVVASTMGCWG